MATEVLRIELQDTGGQQTRSSLIKTGDTVEGLKGRIGNLSTALGGYRTILATIAGGAAVNFITSTLKQVDEIGKLSDKIGASVEALSEYRQVTALADVDFKTFTKSLEVSTIRISEAAQGTGAAKDALTELRIPIDALNRLRPVEQFEAITEAMQGVESQSERLRLAYDIFGRSGTDVVRIINQGTEAIAEQREEFSRMGGTLTRDQVDAAAAANDAIERLTRSFSSLGQELVLLLAGPLGSVIDALTTLIGWIRTAITAVIEFGRAIRRWGMENLFGVAEAAETTTGEVENVNNAMNDGIDVVRRYGGAIDTVSEASWDNLESLEALEDQQVVSVNLMRDSATQALIAAENLAFKAEMEERNAQAARAAAQAEREASRAMRERLNAVTALVGASAQLAGVVTPAQIGSLLTGGQALGTLFGVSGDTLAQLGAAASVGAVGGAVIGGGGLGASIGGALGGAAGSFLGPLGAIAGSALGGILGGLFDSDRQPSVTFGTVPSGAPGRFRGRVGQNTFLSEGALGVNVVGARDGGRLGQAQINFANLLTNLDDAIGGFVEENEERLNAARAAAQAVSNETRAENFDPAENIRIRFNAIFDAIGGVEDELFDAFSPSGDFVPQVIAAIEVLKDLGETSRTVATGWDETNELFLNAVGSLAIINDAIEQDDPIGKIREQIQDLDLTVEESQRRQAQSLIELAQSYDGSIEQTNEMATSISALEQATAQALIGLDAARESTQAATEATAQRIRQSGLSAEEIYQENLIRSLDLLRQLDRGDFLSAEAIAETVAEINRLASQGFFGLTPEQQEDERQRQLDLLEDAQNAADRQFQVQEERLQREHERALEAADRGIDAAAAIQEAAESLKEAINDLSTLSEVA